MQHLVVKGRRPEPGQVVAAGIIAVVVFAGGFAAVLHSIRQASGIADWDRPVLGYALGHRTGPLTSVFELATSLGAGVGLYVVALVVTALASWRLRSLWPVALVAATLTGAEISSNMAKLLIHRARPPELDWLTQVTGYAYPSGHTLLSVATYGVLAYLGCLMVRARWARIAVVAAAAALVLMIATSRLYLGVHWLTDVLGGFLFGAAWLTVILAVVFLTVRD
ncbi:hypothetical protein GCM10009765_76480 [Fodinicola feengrottensis]|uniref:Phosphatidic acid phosphatase type 2/haloperoxidase domain-containing protein n=1 Tax=Fodinicola feengrottensis TaxID=435914 RepID=A0ABN2J2A5_9ACTN